MFKKRQNYYIINIGDFMLKIIIQYIILGIVQGFTEPIPVSSSGHVMIINNLLKTNIDIELLAILTNFGSLIAIVYLYRKKIMVLVKDFFSCLKAMFSQHKIKDKEVYNNFKYCIYLIIGTIPAGIIGLIVTKLNLFDFLDNNIKFVGVTLLITAIFLFLIRNIKGKKDNEEITTKDAIIIGLFQAIAVLPGISRSGATIVGGMTRDLKRETAFDFSFLLYIPISLATGILGFKDLFSANIDTTTFVLYMLATVIAGIITYFATKWFKDIVKKGKLIYFVIYCAIVGTIIILFL